MAEFINSITKSDVFIAACGWLTVNAGTIIGLIIYIVKQGLKRNTSQEEFQKECEKYVNAAKEEATKALQEVVQLMNTIQTNVIDKINYMEDAKKKELESKALELTETIKKAKKQLTFDEIIDDIIGEEDNNA